MVLQEYKPSLMLSEFIRTYRLVDFDYRLDGSLPPKVYPPKAEHCLSFYPKDYETVEYQNSKSKTGNLPTVLFGQQTEVTMRYVGNNFLLIQVVFKPGGLYRLTGIPSNILTNQYIDAETVFSKEIKTVNDKINECKSSIQMIEVVEDFLINEMKKKSYAVNSLDIATSKLFSTCFIPSVDLLAKHSCQSTRNFERHFIQRMGVSPKYFLKVMRFENAFRMKNINPKLDWLSIALNCGFYDHQHLVKDYKSIAGFSPNQFHAIDDQGPDRVFGERDTY